MKYRILVAFFDAGFTSLLEKVCVQLEHNLNCIVQDYKKCLLRKKVTVVMGGIYKGEERC